MEFDCEMSMFKRKNNQITSNSTHHLCYRLKGIVKHFAICLFLWRAKRSSHRNSTWKEDQLRESRFVQILSRSIKILKFPSRKQTSTLFHSLQECIFVEQEIQWDSKFENMTMFIPSARCSVFHCSSIDPVQVELVRMHEIWIISNFVNKPIYRLDHKPHEQTLFLSLPLHFFLPFLLFQFLPYAKQTIEKVIAEHSIAESQLFFRWNKRKCSTHIRSRSFLIELHRNYVCID